VWEPMYPAPPVTRVVAVTPMHCTVRRVIVAVVVTHAAPAGVLERCLAALGDAGGVGRIVVVDNGGTAVADEPGVELLRTANRGYGAAANVGFARAAELNASAVVLLNDDVIVAPRWTDPLVAALAADGVGAVQPVLADPGGERVNSRGVHIGADGAGIDVDRGEPLVAGGEPTALELFTGGAVMLAPAFLAATGGFDERYFLYYEDVDLARRGAALGWHYLLVPASVVEHEGGVSTGAAPGRTRYLQERNRLRAAFRFATPATIGRAVWLSIRRLRHQPRSVHVRALAAGLGAAPVALWERARGRSLEAQSP